MGFTVVDEDYEPSITSCTSTSTSWIVVSDSYCFMLDDIFKTRNHGVDLFIKGSALMKGSQVLAVDDETMLTVVQKPEVREATEVVDLRAGHAMLRVTLDHPVCVPDGHGEFCMTDACYIPAGALKEGDLVVLESGEPAPLTEVCRKQGVCDVLKIVFDQNMPIAVFSEPPSILSKGFKKKLNDTWECFFIFEEI